MPVPEPIVATDVLLLLHIPNGDESLRLVLNPTHTSAVPAIAAGSGTTVTTAVATQPVLATVYAIVSIPAVIPFTTPVEPPIVAFPLDADHVPPEVVSVNVVEDPTHVPRTPPIAFGSGFTVTTVVAIQPVGNV